MSGKPGAQRSSRPLTALYCIFCGRPITVGSARCAGCGEWVSRSPGEPIAEVPAPDGVGNLLAAQRLALWRDRLGLSPDENALVIMRGPGKGSWYRLRDDVFTLGRDREADAILNDLSVSRHHAEVRPVRQGYRLVDLGSLNGTYLDGRRVEESSLVSGDEIRIGLFKILFLTGAPDQDAPGSMRTRRDLSEADGGREDHRAADSRIMPP